VRGETLWIWGIFFVFGEVNEGNVGGEVDFTGEGRENSLGGVVELGFLWPGEISQSLMMVWGDGRDGSFEMTVGFGADECT
jgi:hypothetical protein